MKKTCWKLLLIVMLILMPAIVWAQNLPPIADADDLAVQIMTLVTSLGCE